MNNVKNGHAEKAPSQDVAVYLDFENLYVSLKTTVKMDPNFDLLMEKCREFGRVTVARAYADWSEFTRILTSQMFANGFEPVYVPTRKFYDAKTRAEARKNSVDIHITIDIVKSLFLHENVDCFIVISGDRDYVPLINLIRQHGKSVYAIGVAGCTSSELSAAVDDMFFYHQLLVDESEPTQAVDVYNQLMRAIRMARRRGYPTTLGIIKPIMKELIEGFDERTYKNARGTPFQKFKDLVLEAQNRHLVRLVTTGAVSEVFLWGEEPSKVADQRREEATSARAEGRRDGGRREEGGRERGERGGRGRGRDRGERGGERRPEAAQGESAGESAVQAEAALVGESQGGELSHEEASGQGRRRSRASEDRASEDRGGEERGGEQRGSEERGSEERGDDGRRDEGQGERAELEPTGAQPMPDEQLTGIGLDEPTWDVIRQAVESFGNRPPSPRKLVNTLRQWREEGRFGAVLPTDGDLQELVRQAVEAGKLERVRKGFSTIYRLPEPAPMA